jgi:hypothetical protein
MALIQAPTAPGQPLAAWYGTWKLDIAKSSETAESRSFKSQTSTIEPRDDGVRVTYDIVGVRGGIRHLEWNGRFDGRDYPVQGLDYVMTHAYTPIDDRRYKIVAKMDGVLVATTINEISADGKTLTAVTKGKNALGQDVTTTSVFERR